MIRLNGPMVRIGIAHTDYKTSIYIRNVYIRNVYYMDKETNAIANAPSYTDMYPDLTTGSKTVIIHNDHRIYTHSKLEYYTICFGLLTLGGVIGYAYANRRKII